MSKSKTTTTTTAKRVAATTAVTAKAKTKSPTVTATDKVWNARNYAKAARRDYPVPSGRRLQLSGQWLSDAGFDAGSTYAVRKMKTGLRVIAGESGATITASHGKAKVYVAADLLPEAGQVEVLAVAKGKLFIRQAGKK